MVVLCHKTKLPVSQAGSLWSQYPLHSRSCTDIRKALAARLWKTKNRNKFAEELQIEARKSSAEDFEEAAGESYQYIRVQ